MRFFGKRWIWRLLSPLCVALGVLTSSSAQTQVKLAQSHIPHVIVVMQENRSFDQYLGTFPGAEGIPQGVCVPNQPGVPAAGCTAPYDDTDLINAGGPHDRQNYVADLDGGAMDGFTYQIP